MDVREVAQEVTDGLATIALDREDGQPMAAPRIGARGVHPLRGSPDAAEGVTVFPGSHPATGTALKRGGGNLRPLGAEPAFD